MNETTYIHRYEPAPSGGHARVLLLLHGTGGDESDLLPLGRELDPNAALLSLRGNVSENGMPRFFRRFAEGVFDEEDVIRRANELADFVAAAAKKYAFDLAKVTAVGYSNGANIAAATMLLRPEAFRSAILWRAMIPLSDPPAASDLSNTAVLIAAGIADPIVPLDNAEGLAALLKNRGADVTFRKQQAGHGLVAEDLSAAKEWLAARS